MKTSSNSCLIRLAIIAGMLPILLAWMYAGCASKEATVRTATTRDYGEVWAALGWEKTTTPHSAAEAEDFIHSQTRRTVNSTQPESK